MQNFYVQPNDIDVLFIGSSRIGYNVDGETLWREYGITSYNLWGSAQGFWNSYFYLKEALESKREIRLIVLETSASTYRNTYNTNYQQITNTVGIAGFYNRLNAIIESAPVENRLDLAFELPLYHLRYKELTSNDFKHYNWTPDRQYDKGFTLLNDNLDTNYVRELGYDNTEFNAIDDKELFYLYKIIDLCKEKNIPLLLIKSQSAEWGREQPFNNTIELISTEEGIPFINLNEYIDEQQFSITDFNDKYHLNASGARKNAKYLGDYIKENYGLGNDCSAEAADQWNIASAHYLDSYLIRLNSPYQYMEELIKGNRTVIAIPFNLSGMNAEKCKDLRDALTNAGIKEEVMGVVPRYYKNIVGDTFELGTNNVTIANQQAILRVNISDGTECSVSTPGELLIVYSKPLDKICDISFWTEENGTIVGQHLYHQE